MAFGFYESFAHGYLMVHREDCGHCQFGDGSHGVGDDQETGCWFTGYKTYADARAAAEKKAEPFLPDWDPPYQVQDCQACDPGGFERERRALGERRARDLHRPMGIDEKLCSSCGLVQAKTVFEPGSDVCRDCC